MRTPPWGPQTCRLGGAGVSPALTGRTAVASRMARQGYLRHRAAPLCNRDSSLRCRAARLQTRAARLQTRDAWLHSRDARLQSRDARLQSRNARLQSAAARLQSRDARLQSGAARLQGRGWLASSRAARVRVAVRSSSGRPRIEQRLFQLARALFHQVSRTPPHLDVSHGRARLVLPRGVKARRSLIPRA